jgi:hypothetical protein
MHCQISQRMDSYWSPPAVAELGDEISSVFSSQTSNFQGTGFLYIHVCQAREHDTLRHW